MGHSPISHSAPRRRRRGFALLIVMILIILLTVIVFAFQQDVAREISISGNVRDDLQAAYLAQMGLVRGQVILRLDDNQDFDSLNEIWAQPIPWEGETWGAEGSYGATEEGEPLQPPEIIITDEERKFNLLTLVRGNEAQRKQARDVLTRLIDICRREDKRLEIEGSARRESGRDRAPMSTDNLIRNLIKYLEERASEDSDDLEVTVNPNATPDVRSMRKQTPFEMLTVGELLQVEGWTEDLLHGTIRKADQGLEGRRRNNDRYEEEEGYRDWRDMDAQEKFEQRRDSIESLDDRSRGPEELPLINYITLYSTGFINVNTCSRELLLALDEELSWDVVEQIMTARESDRQDIAAAEENHGELPLEQPPLSGEEEAEEDEDNASFRPQDLASYQAFVNRVNNQATEEGEEPAAVEGLTAEIYNRMRPWLVTRSTVFVIDASATVGKVTHTIRAVYRRTPARPAAQPQPPGGGQLPPVPPLGAEDPENPLPAEPNMNLTLLFRDIIIGG